MSRRRKYATLTKRDIENLRALNSPEHIRFLAGIAVGVLTFCVGAFTINSFTNWLRDFWGISNKFTDSLFTLGFLVLMVLTVSLIIGIPITLITRYKRGIEGKYRAIQLANIDLMTGIDFEHYLKRLLTHRRYSVHVTKASGDLGVDLVASLNSDKFAVQAKRYDTKVSRLAISDAVAGMGYYGCNKAMVITNNYFTVDAVKLAQSTGCMLIDRDTLTNWIIEYQNSSI